MFCCKSSLPNGRDQSLQFDVVDIFLMASFERGVTQPFGIMLVFALSRPVSSVELGRRPEIFLAFSISLDEQTFHSVWFGGLHGWLKGLTVA